MLVERPRRRLSDRLSEPPRHWHEQHRARRGSTESELSLSSGDSAAEDDEYDDDGRGSSRLERKLRHALHEERQLRRLLERRVATLERLVLGEDAAQPAAPRRRSRRAPSPAPVPEPRTASPSASLTSRSSRRREHRSSRARSERSSQSPPDSRRSGSRGGPKTRGSARSGSGRAAAPSAADGSRTRFFAELFERVDRNGDGIIT